MRNLSLSRLAPIAAAVAAIAAPVVSFAQGPIVTATGLAGTVTVADAVGALFIVAGVLLLAGVALMGARLILRKFGLKL